MNARQCLTEEENRRKKWPVWLVIGCLRSVSKQELGLEKEKKTSHKVRLVMACRLKIRASKRESVLGRWKRPVLRNYSVHFTWEATRRRLTPAPVGICTSLVALSPPCAASAHSTEDSGKISIKMLNPGR